MVTSSHLTHSLIAKIYFINYLNHVVKSPNRPEVQKELRKRSFLTFVTTSPDLILVPNHARQTKHTLESPLLICS